MSKDTERLNKMVQAAFFSLHQKSEITHGVVFNLYSAPGSSDVLFPIRSPSGGLSRQLVYYLTATHFTNAVHMGFEDTYPEVEQRMALEMARLQGFIAAMSDQWTQPRITHLTSGGELGVPWKLGGHKTSQEVVDWIERPREPLTMKLSIVETKPGNRGYRFDMAEDLRRVAAQVAADASDCGVPFQIKPAPTCECGAKEGELHFQFCPMWQDLLEVPSATEAE